MDEDIIKLVQSSMVEPARDCFSESELDSLCCVVRITMEFCGYIRSPAPQHGRSIYAGAKALAERCNLPLDASQSEVGHEAECELSYVIGTIFSGMDSFLSLTHSYRSLVGSTGSRVQWGVVSMNSLREQFLSTFQEFATEKDFVKRLRLLIDLFKLQIVFAGVLYDG